MIRTFTAVAAVTVVLDQLTKWWAINALGDGHRISLVGDLLGLRLLYNPGAAFGTGAGYTVALTAVAVAAVVTISVMARRLRDVPWTWAFGLFLGGALGNLIDRIFRDPGVFRGHVVDFIDYNGWFVGNVADLALTIAAILIVIRAWQGVALDGTREHAAPPSRDTSSDD